ncbi:Hypothetical protein LUCI_4483 [Lucifera butyrica]|uniref:Uncharacterized protein n=1 Tax=Lucifera butyrica TaxID=1351585 RepID=A0A498RE38_9FIRM|nr:OadG family protein [Lucifera butyrica]VBB09197.1 Hypothetical protein LUCI_4483 [Lucifera butyrica]
MMWLILLAIAVALFFILRKKEGEGTSMPVSAVPQILEEDELLAVISAAVAQFEGDGGFEVLCITCCGRNWTLTGRQELLHNHL